MAYGLKVWSASGVARVYEGSWLSRFHVKTSITVAKNTTKRYYVSGLNPSTWTVAVTSSRGRYGGTNIYIGPGYIDLTAERYYDITFKLLILAG